MEENLIFFAIGGLLFLTLFVNSVTEAYEQKQREKRIRILRIKHGLDELSTLLENLKNCDISDGIRNLLANEIMTRLQLIQSLDRHFRGIQALIEEASEEQESAPKTKAGFDTKDETEFKKKSIQLSRLIRTLNSHNWLTRVKKSQLSEYIDEVKVFRCEKIFQFYTEMAATEIEKERFLMAKEHYHYILHALKGSGVNSNPRIAELIEQTDFLTEQNQQMFNDNAKKIMAQNNSQDQQEEQARGEEGDEAKDAPLET